MSSKLLCGLMGGLILLAAFLRPAPAGENASRGIFEYATIRWGGRDNTHVIRPGGEVEFVGNQLKPFKRPDRADDRSYYMNIVLNGMARDRWEVITMTSDDIIMRREKQ